MRCRVRALLAAAAAACFLLSISARTAAAAGVGQCAASDARDCDALAAGQCQCLHLGHHNLPMTHESRASNSATSGHVAVISAADGRFVCAAGAAQFLSPRCDAACQFLIQSPRQPLDGAVAGDAGGGAVAAQPQLTASRPVVLPPIRNQSCLPAVGCRRIPLSCHLRFLLS